MDSREKVFYKSAVDLRDYTACKINSAKATPISICYTVLKRKSEGILTDVSAKCKKTKQKQKNPIPISI